MHYACCMYALPGLVGIFCLLLRKCLIKHSLLLPYSPTYLRTGKQMSRFCINHKRADSPTTLTGYGLDFTAYINNDHFVSYAKKKNCISVSTLARRWENLKKVRCWIASNMLSVGFSFSFSNETKPKSSFSGHFVQPCTAKGRSEHLLHMSQWAGIRVVVWNFIMQIYV